MAMTVLVVLLLSKGAYTAAFTSYYTFYLIERFGVTVQLSQVMLFLYLVVGALGVIVGGMVGDRVGRRRVIWISILGSLPFALLLPYVDLFWTGVLSVLIGFIMASAFCVDPDLCDRPGAASRRSGGRTVLRLGVRARRADGRGSRPARRPSRHRRGLQALLVAAGPGPAHVSVASVVVRPLKPLRGAECPELDPKSLFASRGSRTYPMRDRSGSDPSLWVRLSTVW